ncbi:FIST N-terminal domain-containing protein [Pseudomonadota bacterium]
MQQFSIASSKNSNWSVAVEECIDHLGDKVENCNLGFIYSTDAHCTELDNITRNLKAKSGIKHWVGTTGLGILCTGQEIYDRPALNIMVCQFPENSFRIFSGIENDLQSYVGEHSSWLQNNFSNFLIVHADPGNPKVQSLIPELSEASNSGFLVGGLTSSNSQHLQVADKITSGGLSGVVFSTDVAVTTGLSQGCSPIGPKHTITQAERNIIITIDSRPALDVFKEDLHLLPDYNLNNLSGQVYVGLPVRGSDTGDYVVRDLVGVDPKNKIIAISELVQADSQLMFCRRDQQSASEDLIRMVKDVKERAGKATPKGAVYYSCLARGRYTFGDNSEELKIIQNELGDLPVVGFFANGEISHDRLYGYTGVLTLFI